MRARSVIPAQARSVIPALAAGISPSSAQHPDPTSAAEHNRTQPNTTEQNRTPAPTPTRYKPHLQPRNRKDPRTTHTHLSATRNTPPNYSIAHPFRYACPMQTPTRARPAIPARAKPVIPALVAGISPSSAPKQLPRRRPASALALPLRCCAPPRHSCAPFRHSCAGRNPRSRCSSACPNHSAAAPKQLWRAAEMPRRVPAPEVARIAQELGEMPAAGAARLFGAG